MIEEDLEKIVGLENLGFALVEYARSLRGENEFEKKGERWVMRPDNFVTFEPRWKRVKNITISLRGNPEEFIEFPELPIKQGMSGYSECKVVSVNQLAAASGYIRHAEELFKRGATRLQSSPRIVE